MKFPTRKTATIFIIGGIALLSVAGFSNFGARAGVDNTDSKTAQNWFLDQAVKPQDKGGFWDQIGSAIGIGGQRPPQTKPDLGPPPKIYLTGNGNYHAVALDPVIPQTVELKWWVDAADQCALLKEQFMSPPPDPTIMGGFGGFEGGFPEPRWIVLDQPLWQEQGLNAVGEHALTVTPEFRNSTLRYVVVCKKEVDSTPLKARSDALLIVEETYEPKIEFSVKKNAQGDFVQPDFLLPHLGTKLTWSVKTHNHPKGRLQKPCELSSTDQSFGTLPISPEGEVSLSSIPHKRLISYTITCVYGLSSKIKTISKTTSIGKFVSFEAVSNGEMLNEKTEGAAKRYYEIEFAQPVSLRWNIVPQYSDYKTSNCVIVSNDDRNFSNESVGFDGSLPIFPNKPLSKYKMTCSFTKGHKTILSSALVQFVVRKATSLRVIQLEVESPNGTRPAAIRVLKLTYAGVGGWSTDCRFHEINDSGTYGNVRQGVYGELVNEFRIEIIPKKSVQCKVQDASSSTYLETQVAVEGEPLPDPTELKVSNFSGPISAPPLERQELRYRVQGVYSIAETGESAVRHSLRPLDNTNPYECYRMWAERFVTITSVDPATNTYDVVVRFFPRKNVLCKYEVKNVSRYQEWSREISFGVMPPPMPSFTYIGIRAENGNAPGNKQHVYFTVFSNNEVRNNISLQGNCPESRLEERRVDPDISYLDFYDFSVRPQSTLSDCVINVAGSLSAPLAFVVTPIVAEMQGDICQSNENCAGTIQEMTESFVLGSQGESLVGNTGAGLVGNTGAGLAGNCGTCVIPITTSNPLLGGESNLVANTGAALITTSNPLLGGESNLVANTGAALIGTTGGALDSVNPLNNATP